MTAPNALQSERRGRWLWLALVVVGLVTGLMLIQRVADSARQREIEGWRERLTLVVESRATAVALWLNETSTVLASVAENPAAQLYVQSAITEPDAATTQGQIEYLRTLLQATAQRLGLVNDLPPVAANVERPLAPGLAVVTPGGERVTSIGGPLPPPGTLLAAATNSLAIDGGVVLAAQPAVAIAVPLVGPQASSDAPPLAYLYAVRSLDRTAAVLLEQPGESNRDAETLLLRTDGQKVWSLIGRPSGPLPPSPALAQALAKPGTLVVADDQGRRVLALARPVAGTPWFVVRLVEARTALAPINTRYRLMLTSLIAGLAFACALILLAWRHGASVRVAKAAEAAQAAATGEASMRAFLETLARRQPNGIAAIDAQGRFRFVNEALSALLGQPTEIGAPLSAAFGAHGAAVSDLIQRAERATTGHADDRLVINDHILSIAATPLESGEALVTVHDLTALERAHAQREANLNALIDTLAGLIDARDPDSADHSRKVASLAQRTAATLGWSPQAQDTARIAGLLMNLGKILAPRALLTKTTLLTDAELAIVRDGLSKTAALLAGVPFEGPVAQTIAGVHALPSDTAAQTPLARLLRIINQFVGMASPRAHRQAYSVDAAIQALLAQAHADDRPLILALAHDLENQGGRAAAGLTPPV